MKVTNKFRISRVITAAAVLLDNTTAGADDAMVNRIVLGRAAYLIQELWSVSFAKMKHRYQVNDFWRRIHAQVMRSEDIKGFVTVYGDAANPAGTPYGTNVRLELRTDRGDTFHAITITAKKD